MIDVHAHIIPKIDDGAPTFEKAYYMIEKAEKVGFTDIIATSHYMETYYEVDATKMQSLVEKMNQGIKEKGLHITIHTRK